MALRKLQYTNDVNHVFKESSVASVYSIPQIIRSGHRASTYNIADKPYNNSVTI